MSPRSPLVVLALCAVLPACGATTSAPLQVTGPFTAEHAVAFENGLDFIDDPTVLEGNWLHEWEDEVDQRVSLADAVALVTVSTLRTDVDLDRRETFRIVARIDRVRHGQLPEEVTLVSRQGDAGYASVRGNDARILSQRFVLFLKWAEEDGRVVARWHLSPAAERIVRRVNSLVERRHTPEGERRRVIVVEHGSQVHEDETEEDERVETP